jgi:hypothetical protein
MTVGAETLGVKKGKIATDKNQMNTDEERGLMVILSVDLPTFGGHS